MSHPPPPHAPDPPSLLLTASAQKFGVKKKKLLSAEDAELLELAQAAGLSLDPEVFKIIVDLLKMNVAPQAVFQTLKGMSAGIAEASASAEDDDPRKSPKPSVGPPAAAPPTRTTSAAGRATTSKTAAYVPAETSSRNKNAEKKLQRQPSASRGQKSKSTGQ